MGEPRDTLAASSADRFLTSLRQDQVVVGSLPFASTGHLLLPDLRTQCTADIAPVGGDLRGTSRALAPCGTFRAVSVAAAPAGSALDGQLRERAKRIHRQVVVEQAELRSALEFRRNGELAYGRRPVQVDEGRVGQLTPGILA